jgi:hypothetical protein
MEKITICQFVELRAQRIAQIVVLKGRPGVQFSTRHPMEGGGPRLLSGCDEDFPENLGECEGMYVCMYEFVC